MKALTLTEWQAEGTRLFGQDEMKWRFVCPSCKHVQSPEDYQSAGAPFSAVGYSCVGRWIDGSREAFAKGPGPCNYAGGGLIGLNPVQIEGRDGGIFEFARSLDL